VIEEQLEVYGFVRYLVALKDGEEGGEDCTGEVDKRVCFH
jgi:hypothetical protein